MDSSLTSAQLVRLLAVEDRRRVVAALVLHDGPATTSQLVDACGLDLRQVVDAVDRLLSGGLIQEVGDRYELIESAFQSAARAEVPATKPSEHQDQVPDVARILDSAIRDGKLVQWPSKRSKRLVVLDYLAQQFEIGVRYSEREVNDALRGFNDDVATMRRYLVDERFLDRGDGQYWRCGGTI